MKKKLLYEEPEITTLQIETQCVIAQSADGYTTPDYRDKGDLFGE